MGDLIVVEDGQSGIEVIEARVDQPQADDGTVKIRLRLVMSGGAAAEAGSGQEMPAGEQEVALPLVDFSSDAGRPTIGGEPGPIRGRLSASLRVAESRDQGASRR